MKKNFAFACLFTLIFGVVTSCNKEVDTVSVDNGNTSGVAPDFSILKSSNLTEEELIRVMVDYVWFVRENLTKSDRINSLTEEELNGLREAKDDRELGQIISRLGGNGSDIIKLFPGYRLLVKYIADQRLDAGRISKIVARRITEKVFRQRFSAAKTPDCAGLCSQQFNIDMVSCENTLALEIGATLVAGAISGGMVGAGGFIFAVGTYFNCESTAFASFDVCSMNCGMN